MWKQFKLPAISMMCNRLFAALGLSFGLIPAACAQLEELDSAQLEWLGEQVFANECTANYDCLTSWNEGEDFPSLGIGHFIWYQAGQNEVFEETFPALIQHYRRQGIALPSWIDAMDDIDSPWRSREQFYAQFQGHEMMELRDFLLATTSTQVEFIVQRLHRSLPDIVAGFPASQREVLSQRFETIARSHPPFGTYALIDYVHFKGTGLKSGERYRDQGWGLLQVLEEMAGGPTTLYSFVRSADRVLQRRVENAPSERREDRWLQGWQNRLQSYLPPSP